MRLPTETVEELNAEDTAWRLLVPWGIGPAEANLERHTVYTFQARWCDSWRRGRLLLAGDSAHLMPPFAGQGMCSGLRDAVNLAWKLDLILDGRAGDHILDTYGPERAEHVRHFIEASMQLGEVICLPDPVAAASGTRPCKRTWPPAPSSRPVRCRASDRACTATTRRRPALHPGRSRRRHRRDFDDVVGPGGVLLLADPDLRTHLGESEQLLAQLGWKVAAFAAEPGEGQLADTTRAYAAWFAELGAVAVLVRPDLYLYGAAADASDLTVLLQHLLTALRAPESAPARDHPAATAGG